MKPLEQKDSELIRIFIGEKDKYGHVPLYEKIVFLAKEHHLSGATAIKGILSFGANSVIHSAKILDISEDLPIIVEIVDSKEKIEAFLPTLKEVIDASNCGVMITVEKVRTILYASSNVKN